jgi:hypothetical protein
MFSRRFVRHALLAVLSMLAAWMVPNARGQCEPGWQTQPYIVTSGTVYATTMWDPDGSAPQTPRLVVGGNFTSAGRIFANRIATFDPSTGNWRALGTGIQSGGMGAFAGVNALATLPNGDLVAAGRFGNAGGVGASNIARWSNATGQWMPMGAGLGGNQDEVRALTQLPNGDLVAAGSFTLIGGVFANRVARWNAGTGQWLPMGTGTNGSVYALTTLPNGDVIAGGFFSQVGGANANRIARWSPATEQWSPIGTGISGDWVGALITLPNGEVIAGGSFGIAGGFGVNHIVRWTPATGQWSPMSGGMNGGVFSLNSLPSGDVVAGGQFTIAGGVAANRIARWNAATDEWTAMGAGITAGCCHTDYVAVHSIATLPNGDLIVGGNFGAAGGEHQSMIARWGCAGLVCDSIDFNGDGAFFDPQDIEAFLSVYGEGPCVPADASCSDIDFNSDGSLFDPCDIESFLLVFSEGPCTLCGG